MSAILKSLSWAHVSMLYYYFNFFEQNLWKSHNYNIYKLVHSSGKNSITHAKQIDCLRAEIPSEIYKFVMQNTLFVAITVIGSWITSLFSYLDMNWNKNFNIKRPILFRKSDATEWKWEKVKLFLKLLSHTAKI